MVVVQGVICCGEDRIFFGLTLLFPFSNVSNVEVRNRSDRSRSNGMLAQHNVMLSNVLGQHNGLVQHNGMLSNVLVQHNELELNNGLEMQHSVEQHELNEFKKKISGLHR